MQDLPVPGKNAKEYLKRDEKVVSPSYPRIYPFIMDHGRGSEVWDVDGNRYIDFNSGIAVCATGHSHPKVVEAIQKQAERYLHISSDFYHPVWIEFSEKLASTAPFKEPAKVFLGNSGAEAVEAAIKLAKHHTKRQQFIGFYGAFHGRTMGALAFTASKPTYRRGFFPVMHGVTHVPFPDPYRPVLTPTHEDYGVSVVEFIRDVVFQKVLPPEDCAGILIEPIQGEGGYIVPPAGFFPALRELCDQHGILLIADEVMTGAGRTGRWLASHHFDLVPEIVVMGKGLTGGYFPLSSLGVGRNIVDVIYEKGKSFLHAQTYAHHPVGCAAGLAVLNLIKKNDLVKKSSDKGETLMRELTPLVDHPHVGDIRGKGLLLGIEFVEDKKQRQPFLRHKKYVEQFISKAIEKGLVVWPNVGHADGANGDLILLAPPFIIILEEINRISYVLNKTLSEMKNVQ